MTESRISDLPSALEEFPEIAARLRGRPAVFLDYDGTMTPIVPDPQAATIPEESREVLRRLAARCAVGIISGRDLADVRRMVGVEELVYAGSHGFDIVGPDGLREQRGTEYLPALDRAEEELREALGETGARVERKRFAIAMHSRGLSQAEADRVEALTLPVAERHAGLRVTGGKRILEIRPDIEWDKGRALRWLVEVLGLEEAIPVFVGDDLTDEDAFRELEGRGIPVVVRGEDDSRPTRASYVLEDPPAVRRFLERLVEAGS